MTAAAHRRGSILLFALAMVATLAVLAYGFVRVAQLHRQTGDSGNIRLLAREAALTGTNHAVEQLLRDFVTEPFSRMDEPGVRGFSPHDFPYRGTANQGDTEATYTTGGAPLLNVNDMPNTDGFDPILWGNGNGGHLPYLNGYSNETGRGRFYEVEFYNLPGSANYNRSSAPYAYNAAVTDPTVIPGTKPPVKFGSPYPDPLDRSGGIFYDDRFCRITDPDPRVAREKARYRLRYSVMTMDLEGMLLVNGDQSVHFGQIKDVDPTVVTRDDNVGGAMRPFIYPADVESVQRMVRSMHKLPAIVDAENGWGISEGSNRFLSGRATGGAAAEHVFIGRGSVGNVNKHPDSTFAPTTFPYMYRAPGDFAKFAMSSGPDGYWLGPDPFATTVGTFTVQGDVTGNEVIPYKSSYPRTSHSTFVHMLTGPQYTFMDYLHATYGDASEGVDDRGMSPLGRFTTFGRGVSQRATGEAPSRYRSQVDTPWSVNLLTATPRLIYAMVAGYMPPGAICVGTGTFTYDLYGNAPSPDNPSPFPSPYTHQAGSTTLYLDNGTGTIRVGDTLTISGVSGTYHVTSVAVSGLATVVGISPSLLSDGINNRKVTFSRSREYTFLRTRDLFVKQLSPAFDHFDAPIRLASGPNPAIQPDYHVDDFWTTSPATSNTIHRGPQDRYPGEMAYNGYDPTQVHALGANDFRNVWQCDRLGIYLRTAPAGTGTTYDVANRYATDPMQIFSEESPDTHASRTFWFSLGNSMVSAGKTSQSTTPTPHQTQWYGKSQNSFMGPHPDSIWEAIGQAMGATASVVKGQYYQYQNDAGGDPTVWFDAGPWVGPRVQSIKDVDDLFVRNLGSDPAIPNDPNPVAVWYTLTGKLKSGLPGWNLAALNDQNPKCVAMASNPGLMPATAPTPNLPIYAYNLSTETGYDGSKPTYTATERSQIAELIINDFRMSFFGASPQYGDDFRVYDLNGDGKAACSCYPSNPGATAKEQNLRIDQYSTSVDPATGIALDPVASDPSNTYFSNTGTFLLGKSRFWRILVRGEVWDNVLQTTIDRAQLDTVLCIDPLEAANECGTGPQDPGAGMYATHIMSQIWLLNGIRDFLPKRY